jgi:hypothetical protein
VAVTVPDCVEVEIGGQGQTVRLPGGPTLQVMVPQIAPDGIQVTKNLLTQASAALAPLMPVFQIIDAILAIKAFADAVPDSVGPPFNVTAVIQALAGVSKKVAKLASLIPQLAVPLLVVDVIDVVIQALNGAVTQLEAVVVQEAKIAAALTKATETGNDALLQVVACADDFNVATRNGISEGLGPLNSLFGVLNLFLGLIGAPEVPALDDLPDDAQQAIDQLKSVVDLLQNLRDSIPIP